MKEEEKRELIECDGCAGTVADRLDRQTVLSHLEVGDILCAKAGPAPLIICLVTKVADDLLMTRRVTDGSILTFDRMTGVETSGRFPAEIVSVEPLPADIHDIILKIDRRCRLQVDRSHFRMGDEEKKALFMINNHYYSNLI